MKKSDAVNKIKDYIEYWEGHPNKEAIAVGLLSIMEHEIGMRPPGYVGVFATGKKYNKETDQGRDLHDFNGWEPE